jgi:hypothetical protein
MRVLIVEDSPERQEILRNLYRDHAWILVNTAARAKCLLDAYDFDLVSLDFDLAGEAKGDDVAHHLLDSCNSGVEVIIHSDNAPGAARITSILPNAVYVPISKITKSNAVFKKLRDELNNGPKINWAAVFASRNQY